MPRMSVVADSRRKPAAVGYLAGPAALLDPFPQLVELSRQERKIVALWAIGYIDKEIAHELEIHPATVKTYVQRIYDKLKVRTKAAVVALAFHRLSAG